MNKEQLYKIRHSAEHVFAQAITELYPEVKLAVAHISDDGFANDSQWSKQLSEKDFAKIEKRMQAIISKNLPITRKEIPVAEAREMFKDNPFKLEWVEQHANEGKTLTVYWTGDRYVDLCKGPHVENTGEIGAIKLMSLSGAYWRGDQNNAMLTRVYGTAFATQAELDEYLERLEQAKTRDHRKIGKELGLFTFSELVGSGLPLFTPKGTFLREELNKVSQDLREKIGFERVWVPHIAKNDLYKVSGHWDKFGNEWLLINSQETSDQLVMKPMNCPHHQQIYAAEQRSYKDLPLRYMETTTVYRDEKAGELLGLSRVRSITQDDSHLFCTVEQIEEEYTNLIKIVDEFYKILGMKYRVRLSLRDPAHPEKYHGDPETWDKAEAVLREIAEKNKLNYYEGPGEAAFYGPKMDFMVTDAIGREWQCGTPQLDFVQPKRFGLVYTAKDGSEKTPVMIHFALMGGLERFISVYIEHTIGSFPLWLSYHQAVIIPVSNDKHFEYCNNVRKQLKAVGVRVAVDDADETLGNRIRKNQSQKIPYMIIVGDKEIENGTINIRMRGGESLGEMKVEDFAKRVHEKVENKALDL